MDGAINIYRNVIKNCFKFKGRMDRRQYWLFIVLHLVVVLFLLWLNEKTPNLPIWQAYVILMLLPYISATIKRLHDINKSGWWALCWLIPVFGWVYLFVLCIENASKDYNKYGAYMDWANAKDDEDTAQYLEVHE